MMSKRFLNSASIQPPLDVRRRKIQATFRLMMDDIFGYFRVLLLPSHKCTFHGLHIRNWAFFGPTTAALHHNHKHRRFDEVGRGGAERSGACHATPPRYPQMYAHISRRRSLPPSMRSHSPLPLSLSLSLSGHGTSACCPRWPRASGDSDYYMVRSSRAGEGVEGERGILQEAVEKCDSSEFILLTDWPHPQTKN